LIIKNSSLRPLRLGGEKIFYDSIKVELEEIIVDNYRTFARPARKGRRGDIECVHGTLNFSVKLQKDGFKLPMRCLFIKRGKHVKRATGKRANGRTVFRFFLPLYHPYLLTIKSSLY
jgi:hypothetical protein